MEKDDVNQLAERIAATQRELAQTVADLKHETSPAVVAGRVKDDTVGKIRGFVFDEDGRVRAQAIIAGSAVLATIATLMAVKVARSRS